MFFAKIETIKNDGVNKEHCVVHNNRREGYPNPDHGVGSSFSGG